MNELIVKSNSLVRQLAYIGFSVILITAMLVAMAMWMSRYVFVAEIFNNFRLQASLVIFTACIVLYSLNSKYLASTGLLVGLITFWPVASNWIPVQQPEPGPKIISLLSYNVLGENYDREPVVSTLEKQFADMVVVLEYENFWAESLEQLSKSYAYSVKSLRWHGFGIAMFSRLPIEDSKVISITKTETDNPIIVAEIQINQQSFVVVAAHFLSPLTNQKMGIRNRQIAEVTDIISEIQTQRKLPVILVGDFNCVAWSPFLQDAMQRCSLRDSRNGYLYHGSWPTRNPLLHIPIDNALVSEEIYVHQRKILPADTSDHFPLYLEFSISEQ